MSKRRRKGKPKQRGVTGLIWEFTSYKDPNPKLKHVKEFFCGFPVISKNRNQLWLWESLENVV